MIDILFGLRLFGKFIPSVACRKRKPVFGADKGSISSGVEISENHSFPEWSDFPGSSP